MAYKGIVSGGNYSFNAAAQTITFSNDYLGMSLSDVTYITNIKNGIATVIYDPFDATKGGTLNGLTLTLSYNTTAMANSDPLQIIVGFTPALPEPALVKTVPQSGDIDQVQLLQNVSDQLDYLATSLDQTEGIQVNVREINPAKRDVNNAQIPSDGVTYNAVLRRLNDALSLDASGYNSVDAQLWGDNSVSGISFIVEGSSDNVNWVSIPYMEPAQGTASLTISGFTMGSNSGRRVLFATSTKFIRIRLSAYTAGSIHVTANLRQQPFPTGPFTQLPVNVASIGGGITSPGAGTNTSPVAGTNYAGALGNGGILNATTNQINATSTIANTVPYPLGSAGREQPYMGNAAGIFRYLTVDGGGKIVLGGDAATTSTAYQSTKADGSVPGLSPRGVGGIPNNMIGAQNLTVTDTSQVEGDTNTMLLKQILQELKILNQQMTELPILYNLGLTQMSDPQEYRNDNSNLF